MVTTQQETDFYNYLVNKDYQNNGFFRYGFFKKIMKWYFGVFNEYRYRKIFNNMVGRNLFFRTDTNGQRTYLYCYGHSHQEDTRWRFVYNRPKKLLGASHA